ncbi:MAG TPA: amidohydrolase family protein [Stellaceae bacterium]|nr:amidohydrolase family protein [Stellaceae bacterium]
MSTTVIKHADWVIAWNESQSRHEYLRDGDVVFAGDRITFVGRGYSGPADREIGARGRMVMPGFVNIHSHPASEPFNRGLMEERGSPRLGMSSLYEFMLLVRPDEDTRRAAALFAVSELLKSGVTTFTDYSATRAGWIEDLAGSGIRACLAPSYRSARWFTRNGHRVEYEWNEAVGREAMTEALSVIDAAARHESGRLSGMLAPAQVDTCTEELLQASVEAAKARNTPLQIHASQSVVEFREMTARHGKTPLEWLDEVGVLYDGAIIAHCIFVDEHSWIRWPHRGDLERMARSGASVAHCPNIFARRGILLQDFGKYRRLGINIGLGTDTFPHNFIDEMRWAVVLCKVAAENVEATSLADVFHAATVGGAKALLRNDLGRLAIGCKADLSLIDLQHPSLQPVRDPLKSLVFSGLDRPVTDVFVDGRPVVVDGQVTTIDVRAVSEAMSRGQQAALAGVSGGDYAGRPLDQIFPMTLPMR